MSEKNKKLKRYSIEYRKSSSEEEKRVHERILEIIQKNFTQQSVEENKTKRYIEKC